MLRIDELFRVEYGTRGLGSKSDLDLGNTPVIASGDDATSFGIHSLRKVEATQTFCLTIARTGSAGASYFRGYPCTPTDDCIVLTPKEAMTIQEMIWYQEALRSLRPLWSYGRKVTPDKLRQMRLPSPPAWVSRHSVPDMTEVRKSAVLANGPILIEPGSWHRFRLDEIFTFNRGGGLTSHEASATPGKVPFIGAAKINNGIVAFTGAKKATYQGGRLTLVSNGQGGMGYCFYQADPFIASQDITILTPMGFKLNTLTGVFMATVIMQMRPLFSYGRKMTPTRIKDLSVDLPSDDEGKTPSLRAMEDLMRRLPFSKPLADGSSALVVQL